MRTTPPAKRVADCSDSGIADEARTRRGDQCADLLKAELVFAVSHSGSDRFVAQTVSLVLHLRFDAQALERLCLDVVALALSEYATESGCNSASRSCCSLPIRGADAPSRTTTPMRESASSTVVRTKRQRVAVGEEHGAAEGFLHHLPEHVAQQDRRRLEAKAQGLVTEQTDSQNHTYIEHAVMGVIDPMVMKNSTHEYTMR